MNDPIIIQRIKKRMRELGLNARKLAKRSSVGKSFVYDILSGKSRNPTSSKLALISKELDTSVSYLIGDNDIDIDTRHYSLGYSLLEENPYCPKILLSRSHFDLSIEKDLRTFTIPDNSMEPLLYQYSTIILDVKNYQGIPIGIFVIKYHNNYMVRKLQHVIGSNKIKIIAENRDYGVYEEDINQLHIIGKVEYCLRQI